MYKQASSTYAKHQSESAYHSKKEEPQYVSAEGHGYQQDYNYHQEEDYYLEDYGREYGRETFAEYGAEENLDYYDELGMSQSQSSYQSSTHRKII